MKISFALIVIVGVVASDSFGPWSGPPSTNIGGDGTGGSGVGGNVYPGGYGSNVGGDGTGGSGVGGNVYPGGYGSNVGGDGTGGSGVGGNVYPGGYGSNVGGDGTGGSGVGGNVYPGGPGVGGDVHKPEANVNRPCPICGQQPIPRKPPRECCGPCEKPRPEKPRPEKPCKGPELQPWTFFYNYWAKSKWCDERADPWIFKKQFNEPTVLEIVDTYYDTSRYEIFVDGQSQGRTSDKDSFKNNAVSCYIGDDCVQKGFSHGHFQIPAGFHEIEIRWVDGPTRSLGNGCYSFNRGAYRLFKAC